MKPSDIVFGLYTPDPDELWVGTEIIVNITPLTYWAQEKCQYDSHDYPGHIDRTLAKLGLFCEMESTYSYNGSLNEKQLRIRLKEEGFIHDAAFEAFCKP
jgi:hypothetical protein